MAKTLAQFLRDRRRLPENTRSVVSDGVAARRVPAGPFARPITDGTHAPFAKTNAARGIGFGR
jgi:hypothetical protein